MDMYRRLSLLLIVTLFVVPLVLASRRPSFFKSFGHGQGHRTPGNPRQIVFSDRLHGRREVLLDYNVTLRQGVHSLDEDLDIVDIDCPSSSTIFISFATATPTRETEVGNWEYITIGAEWHCGGAHPVIVQAQARQWLNSTRVWLTVVAVQFEELFEDAVIQYSEHALAVTPALVQEVPPRPAVLMSEGKELHGARLRHGHSGNDANEAFHRLQKRSDMSIAKPEQGAVYWTGNNITVEWNASWAIWGEYFDVSLHVAVPGGLDAIIVSKTRLSYTTRSTTFTIEPSWQNSSLYYAKVSWCGPFSCDVKESQRFMVNPKVEVALLQLGKPSYAVGETITIKWVFLPSVASKDCWLKLWIRNYDDDDTEVASYGNMTISDGTRGVNVTVKDTWITSSQYYWELRWNCATSDSSLCSADYSDDFTITMLPVEEKISVVFLEPVEGRSYFSGDVLKIKWNHTGISAGGKDIKLALKYEAWGPDPELWSEEYTVNRDSVQEVNLTLSPALESNTQYYIEAKYNCGFLYCSKAETSRFSINYHRKFSILGVPPEGTQIAIGTPLTISWTASDLSPNTAVYVRLMKLYPLVRSKPYVDDAMCATTVGAGNWTYTPQEGTIFPVYFDLSYDCRIGSQSECTRESSNTFLIPATGSWDWNYDATTGAATKHVATFFDYSCTNCSTDPSASCPAVGVPRNLCNKHMDSSVKLTCEDCYIKNTASGTDFRIEISHRKILSVRVLLWGTSHIKLGNVIMNFEASWTGNGETLLHDYPIYDYSFTVGEVPITVGLDGKLYGVWAASVSTSALATLSHVANITYNVEYQSGGTFPYKFIADRTRTVTLSDFNIAGPVEAQVTLGLKTAIEFGIHPALKIDAWIQPQIDVGIRAAIPPFQATTNPLIPGTLWPLGNCSTNHYLEDEVNFSANIGASASAIFFGKTQATVPILEDLCLTSGCWLPVDNETINATELTFACTSLDAIGITQHDFEMLFTSEVAAALSFSRSRLITKLTSTSPIGITLTILPSSNPLDHTSPQILALIEAHVNLTQSSFYSGWLGTRLNCDGSHHTSTDNINDSQHRKLGLIAVVVLPALVAALTTL